MGSYISIYNNTEDSYLVKVGPDEAAIQIAGIATAVIGAVGTIVATAGAGAPLAASLVANGVVDVLGLSTSVLASVTALAASISGLSIATSLVGWSQSIVLFITKTLIDEHGFVEVKPGETRQFGKFTLSLWRQGTCIRVRQNPSNLEEVVIDNVYMRPIFSGPTDGSTLVHGINYWIQKFGHEGQVTVRAKSGSALKAALGAPPSATGSVELLQMAEEAGIKAKRDRLRLAGLATEEYEPGQPSGGRLALV